MEGLKPYLHQAQPQPQQPQLFRSRAELDRAVELVDADLDPENTVAEKHGAGAWFDPHLWVKICALCLSIIVPILTGLLIEIMALNTAVQVSTTETKIEIQQLKEKNAEIMKQLEAQDVKNTNQNVYNFATQKDLIEIKTRLNLSGGKIAAP